MCGHPSKAEHVLKKKFSMEERRYSYKTMARKRGGVYTVGGHKERALELFQHLHEAHSQASLKNISRRTTETRRTGIWQTRGQIAKDNTAEDAELIFAHAAQREHPAVPGLVQWLVTQDQESCAQADEEIKGVESTSVITSDDAMAARKYLKKCGDVVPSIGDVVPLTKASSSKAITKPNVTKVSQPKVAKGKAKATAEEPHLKMVRLAVTWAENRLATKPATGPLLELLKAQIAAMEDARTERNAEVCVARVKAAKTEFTSLHKFVK